MNIKSKKISIIFLILSIFLTTFIFINSSFPAEVSNGESNFFMNIINSFFKNIGFSSEITNHIVRKLAHFCEFALLGFFTVFVTKYSTGKYFKNITVNLFWCISTAVTDEFIQLFVEGRAGKVIDVLIDFGGSLTGIMLSILFLFIIDRFRIRRELKNNGDKFKQ